MGREPESSKADRRLDQTSCVYRTNASDNASIRALSDAFSASMRAPSDAPWPSIRAPSDVPIPSMRFPSELFMWKSSATIASWEVPSIAISVQVAAIGISLLPFGVGAQPSKVSDEARRWTGDRGFCG